MITSFEQYLEKITIPVKVGDIILKGRFKNKRTEVKKIGKDQHNIPTINGKPILTFRYGKKEKEEK